MQVIRHLTPRMILSTLHTADLSAAIEHFQDPEILLYSGIADPKQIEPWFAMQLQRQESGCGLQLALRLHDNDQLIGVCGLSEFNPEHRFATLSYSLDRQYWGQGLMTEAVISLTQLVFEHLPCHRLQALVVTENVRSVRLLQRLGWVQEGSLRALFYIGGQYKDALFLSTLRDEQRTNSENSTDQQRLHYAPRALASGQHPPCVNSPGSAQHENAL